MTLHLSGMIAAKPSALRCAGYILAWTWVPCALFAQLPTSEALPAQPPTVVMRTLTARPQQDTGFRRLPLERFLALVKAFHPVARQAELLTPQAEAELRQARGLFDPTLNFGWYGKTLKDKDYYSDLNGELKIPTWLGFDLKAGYERVVGDFINPERATRNEGLLYAGIRVPILRDWIIDQRRAAVRQAQLLGGMAEAERIKTLNKLLFSAAKDYWMWYEAWRAVDLLRYGLELAEFRLQATRARILAGDMAALDSVEALLEVQRRQGQLYEAEVVYRNSRVILAAYLWSPAGEPAELQPGTMPDTLGTQLQPLTDAQWLDALAFATNRHPEVLKLEFKLRDLDIERKLRINNLLPQMGIEYKPLLFPTNPTDGWAGGRTNYKYGIDFYFPLFLRKEQGKLEAVRLKARATDWELSDTRRQVLAAAEATRNDLNTFEQLVTLQNLTVRNARLLLMGEQERFENGESSLFLVNQRERTLLEAELKLAGYQAKYAATRIAFLNATGQEIAAEVR